MVTLPNALRIALRHLAAEPKKPTKLRVFDFDETLAVSEGSITVEKSDGQKITFDSATFAHFKPRDGDKLDFTEFNNVNHPRKIKKNWDDFVKASDDPNTKVVILTARPKGSASAVSKYLESEGVKGTQVVDLQSSDPYDKARWIDKTIEEGGYTDVEFVDDSSKNARAVAEHGEAHKKKGLKFNSVNSPHPKETDYAGPASKSKHVSDNPTTVISESTVKKAPEGTAGPGGKGKPEAGPSDWWADQSPEFHKSYCREHTKSKYCGHTAGEVKMASDLNEAEVDRIKARASKSKNKKVKKYLPDLLEKIDQAGPAAGIWLEHLEAHFDTLSEKPEGLLKDFEPEDFADLFEVAFGYAMKSSKSSSEAALLRDWFPRGR